MSATRYGVIAAAGRARRRAAIETRTARRMKALLRKNSGAMLLHRKRRTNGREVLAGLLSEEVSSPIHQQVSPLLRAVAHPKFDAVSIGLAALRPDVRRTATLLDERPPGR
jgi:hypothetical protein